MMKPLRSFLPALFILTLPFIADAKLARTGVPSVQFTGKGTVGTLIGKGNELEIADDGTTVTVTVPLANLQTGIALRDRHMRDKYLEVGRFPKAELVVPRAALNINPGVDPQGDVQGTFSLHGVSKPVTFNFKATRKGEGFGVVAKFKVNVLDFGIQKPSYLGVGINPDMDIEVAFDAVDK